VHLDEPRWWYRAAPSTAAKVLAPVGAVYGWAARTLYQTRRAHRAALPVICIGNFTAGGTGKTPLAIYLCQSLQAAGHAPVALMRGYGGRLAGPYWVNGGTDRARDVGDEALLIARVAPTLVARNRKAGAEAIAGGPHPVSVIVMDDGLQNPTLAKDLTVAVVDGRRGVGNGLVIPAGPLRAALDMQLDLTDAVIVNEPAGATGTVSDWLRHRFAGPVLRGTTVAAAALDGPPAMRVLAWAGIGAPERFFCLLRRLGAELVATARFPDHHRLSPSEAETLMARARALDARLLTTEKDWVRLAGEDGALAELAQRSHPLPVKFELAAADAERLFDLIDTALKARRAPGPP